MLILAQNKNLKRDEILLKPYTVTLAYTCYMPDTSGTEQDSSRNVSVAQQALVFK